MNVSDTKTILAKDNTPAPPFAAVPMEFKVQRIADLLCSALEGGSNYWCRIDQQIAPPPENLRCSMNVGGGLEIYPHIDLPALRWWRSGT